MHPSISSWVCAFACTRGGASLCAVGSLCCISLGGKLSNAALRVGTLFAIICHNGWCVQGSPQSASRRIRGVGRPALHLSPYSTLSGFCYHGLQEFQKAIDCYTSALELSYHRTFVVLANRANCLFRKSRYALPDLQPEPNHHLCTEEGVPRGGA